jgi:hypothetical protein
VASVCCFESGDVKVGRDGIERCGGEFIRECGIPSDEYLMDVPASSRMNSLPLVRVKALLHFFV